MKLLITTWVFMIWSFSFTANASVEVENLLTQHQWMRSHPQLLGKMAPNVLDQTQRWIHAHQNDPVLKTKLGEELLASQTHLTNYLAVKNQFENCVIKSQRQLDARILDANLATVDVPCSLELIDLQNLDELNQKIAGQMLLQQKKQFQSDVLEQQLINSAKTYMNLKHRYEPKYVASKDVGRIVKDFCQHGRKNVCTSDFKISFTQTLNVEAQNLSGAPRTTIEKARIVINQGVEKLNVLLAKIPVRTEGGSIKTPIWDSSQPVENDEYTQAGFSSYVNEYFKVVGTGDGLLMMTETIKGQSSGLRRIQKDDMIEDINYFDQSKFTFKPHIKVSNKDIKKAITEAKLKVVDGVRLAKNLAESESGLKAMVKANPVAVGQLLARKPEMAALVCAAINGIDGDDQYQKEKDEMIMWGGLIVGGGLAVTGIGAGVGAAIVTATSTAATLTSVATYAIVGSAAAGAFEGGYSTVRALQIKSEYDQLERAVLSHNTDVKGHEEAQDALAEFQEARLSAAMAIGFSLGDAGAFKFLSRAPVKNLESLKKLNVIYKKVAETDVGQKFNEVAKLLGEKGASKLDEFFGSLTNASESVRQRLFEHLSTDKFDPESFKKLVDEALMISGGCKI